MIVTVAKAAKMVRKNRQTLYNHNKTGKLTFSPIDDDTQGVDVAELRRVYGQIYLSPKEMAKSKSLAVLDSESVDSTGNIELENKVNLLELELKHARETIEQLKPSAAEKDNVVRLLEHDKSKAIESSKHNLDEAREREKDQKIAHERRESDQAMRIEQAQQRTQDESKRVDDLAYENARFRSTITGYKNLGLIDRLLNRKPDISIG